MIVTSSEENLLTSPANSTSVRTNPFGPVTYGFPRPIGAGGIGQIDPISAGIMAGVGVGSQIIQTLTHPSVTGIQAQDATTLVNSAEIYLKMNLNNFMGSAKTAQDQANALYIFDNYWAQVASGCANLAGPGTKCVNDRAPGGKFDWFKAYRDPIANSSITGGSTISTANVSGGATPGATTLVDTVSQAIGVSSGMGTMILLGIGAIVVMKMFSGSRKK